MSKHTVFAALAIGAAVTVPATFAVAGSMGSMSMSGSKVYALKTQNGSGEMGTVTLTPEGQKTMVTVALVGAPTTAQPAHVHTGTCAKLDPTPKYPLTSAMDGVSMTTLDVPIAKLTGGGFAVNVHKSADDLKDYVACGDLGG